MNVTQLLHHRATRGASRRAGIFLSKAGNTASIDPRRMEDVHRIRMTWNDPGLFEGLD
jgi:hypothetical protein